MAIQTPAQIEFENLTATSELRAAIDQHLSELETRFGRATAGRIGKGVRTSRWVLV